MGEISLEKLTALLTVGERLKKLLSETPEVLEYLRMVNGGEEKNILPMKADVLISAGEAAQVLSVGKETIYRYAAEKILTPLYTPYSNRMKFWLSEVKGVAKKAG